jgi:hypothetical protein
MSEYSAAAIALAIMGVPYAILTAAKTVSRRLDDRTEMLRKAVQRLDAIERQIATLRRGPDPRDVDRWVGRG